MGHRASFSVFCLYLAVNQPITDVGSDSANYSTSTVTKFTLKIFVDDWALQPKRIVTETFLWCPWIDQLFSTNLKASNRIFNVVDSQEARQYGVVTPGTKAIKPFSLFPIQTKITAKLLSNKLIKAINHWSEFGNSSIGVFVVGN